MSVETRPYPKSAVSPEVPMVLNGRTTTRLVSRVTCVVVLVCAWLSAIGIGAVVVLLPKKNVPAMPSTARPTTAPATFSQTAASPLASTLPLEWLDPCEAEPGVFAAAALASSATVTPSLAKARITAC
ncbi:MAG: hypothetical protein HN607_04960 [Verrucomicrobia bacterium]|nr:hypothetical protein [Verrucomicrobiota bacterium]